MRQGTVLYCSGFGIAQDFEETPLLFPPQDEWPGRGTFFPSPYSQVDKCYTPLSDPNQRDRLQEVDYVCRWKRGRGAGTLETHSSVLKDLKL